MARIWHFLVMVAFLTFIGGHLVMVLLHGWNNFVSMVSGWKKESGIFALAIGAADTDSAAHTEL